MPRSEEDIQREVKAVGALAIIPSMLKMICKTTGMGFAAVAKVTQDRWIACGVRDEINFGLPAGGELKIQTTICNEIRDSGKGVIIDHVETDPQFCNHHTPLMYGFQSYISIPIFLKDGTFFGTLCAIDPKPAQLKDTEVVDLFNLFTDLLSFHISYLQEAEKQKKALYLSSVELRDHREELRQYRHLSNHTLQEPLRKIRLFSDMLVSSVSDKDDKKIKDVAQKIYHFAADLTQIVKDISEYTGVDLSDESFKTVPLDAAFQTAFERIESNAAHVLPTVSRNLPHSVLAVEPLVIQLFRLIIQHVAKHAGAPVSITLESTIVAADDAGMYSFMEVDKRYCRLHFLLSGSHINIHPGENAFEMNPRTELGYRQGLDTGLAMSRKIVRLLGGTMLIESPGKNMTSILIILPLAEEDLRP